MPVNAVKLIMVSGHSIGTNYHLESKADIVKHCYYHAVSVGFIATAVHQLFSVMNVI